jgi:4-hydroxy-2-oxoheptanedioate aldolase
MDSRTSEPEDTRIIFGIWQQIPIPMISRFLAQMGWDWIILDLQHGCFSWETAYECIHTVRAAGRRPLVRVGIGQTSEVQKAFDLGAGGVIVPMVNSREESERMAAAAKYPPLGDRSIGGDPHYHYGLDYADRANETTLLLLQIEHIQAVDNVEAILDLPGVDGCFVGPTDLALSMGLPRVGFEKIAEHRRAIDRIVDVCRRLNKLACTNTYGIGEAADKITQGYQCITLRSDADLFVDSARGLLKSLRVSTEQPVPALHLGGPQ